MFIGSPRQSSVIVLVVTATACSVYDASLLEGPDSSENADSSTDGTPGVSTTTDKNASTNTSVGGAPTNSTTTGSTEGNTGGGGGTTGGDQSATGGTSSESTVNSSSNSTTTGAAGGTTGDNCENIDCCPTDDTKMAPGQCGCEIPDTDSDADGTADCVDECPNDAQKTAPGACGCGIPDEDTTDAIGCASLRQGLAHRYSFAGSGSEATDSEAGAHGTIVGAALDGTGELVLNDGSNDQYVELPSGILSSLTNASIEAWFTWAGGPMWTRLFDFGNTVEGVAGQPGTGETFVLFTPRGPDGPDYPYATFYNGDATSEAFCSGGALLPSGEAHHVVLSLDTDNDLLSLYLDGALSCSKALSYDLATLVDVNNWIGRSQFEADELFVGSVDEFRIYDIALSEEQVLFSLAQGPNPSFFEY